MGKIEVVGQLCPQISRAPNVVMCEGRRCAWYVSGMGQCAVTVQALGMVGLLGNEIERAEAEGGNDGDRDGESDSDRD